MEEDNAGPRLATRLRRLMPFFLGGLGMALVIGGIAANYLQSNLKMSSPEKTNVEASFTRDLTASVSGQKSAKGVFVEASGAIEKPGVYEMPYDSRVKDVLITAGGLVAKADRNYVSKNINLAQRIVDGQKIYFPFQGEVMSNLINRSNINTISNNIININTATADQLDSLPGIGLVTCDKIIAGRPYQNVSELQSKNIVSNSVYQKIKDRISVN